MQQTSSPPAALVKITATFMVIGSEAAMTIPLANSLLKPIDLVVSSVHSANTALDTTKKLKHYKKILNLILVKAFLSSSNLRKIPCIKNMVKTATQEAVIFGARYLSANGGSIVAMLIAKATFMKNEYFM